MDWLQNNAGTVITVSGSIVVAIIAGAFALWAKNHTPKTPVPIQDVWGENRALRADLRGVELRIDELDTEYKQVRDAVGVLWMYLGRVRSAWGRQPAMPVLTTGERKKLAAVLDEADLSDI